MALTRGQKAAALGKGAAVGGGTTAALGAAVGAAMRGVASVAPAVASVASKALPVLAVSYAAGSAVVAGVRSAKRGESAAEVAKHAALGAVGLDSIAIPKTSTRVEFEMKHGKPMGLGGPKDDSSNKTIAERQKELAEKNGAGGDPAVYKKIAENSRRQMAKAKTNAERNAQERRALLAEEKYEKLTGEHIGPTKPEPKQEAAKPGPAVVEEVKPGEGFGSRMLRKTEAAVENMLFGPGKPKAEDAMAKERAQLERAAGETRARLDDEFKNRGGAGPKYDKLKKEADEASGKLADLTKKQTEKEAEEAAGYRQLGAMVTGAAVGVWLGGMTKKAAENAAKVAEKGINQLADKAQKLVNSAPKGVIKGTVEGDKAAAAVAAAKSASTKPLVTNAEAYALPALNVAHGGVAIGLAKSDPEAAIAAYREALKLDGKLAAVRAELGALLSDRRRLDEAAAELKAAVQVDPTLADAWGNLARLEARRGNAEESFAAFAKAEKLADKDVDLRVDHAMALRKAGRHDDAFPVQPPRALWEIRQALGRDDILISDVGLHKLWISRMFPAREPNTVLIANGLAGMGFAVPSAVAAKLVHPDRNVVTVSGDGGFLMNFQELETATRLRTPFVNVVWENRQYGSIVWKQDKKFGRHFGVDFTNPDFVKLGESFGLPAWRCESADDFGARLRQALALDVPSLIVLPIDYSLDVAMSTELGTETVPT